MMTCPEFLEQVEAYALDALEPQEHAACEVHLASTASHSGCHEALAGARATVSQLALTVTPVRVPSQLWRQVEAKIQGTSHVVALRPRWREPLAWALAAGLALAFVGARSKEHAHQRELAETRSRTEAATAAVFTCRNELEALRSAVSFPKEALAMLETPGTAVVPLAPQPGHTQRATVLFNGKARRAMLVSGALRPVPGKDYVLWVIEGKNAPRSAGILHGSTGVALAEFDPALLAHANALAVSLEPLGGAAVPTDILLVGAVQGS